MLLRWWKRENDAVTCVGCFTVIGERVERCGVLWVRAGPRPKLLQQDL